MRGEGERKYFVVGFPSTYACCFVETLVLRAGGEVVVLCPPALVPAARMWARGLQGGKNIEILEGDPVAIDFGLSGKQWMKVAAELDVFFHFFSPGNPSRDVARALGEALEMTEAASRCRRAVFIGLFCAGQAPSAPLSGGGEVASLWNRNAVAVEKILAARRMRLPWTLIRCAAPAVRVPTFVPGKPADLLDAAVACFVLLHCQVDIKTLRRISARAMPLTPVQALAEETCSLIEKGEAVGEILEAFYDGGLDVDALRGIVDAVFSAKPHGREYLSAMCRKFGPKLFRHFCGDVSPDDLMDAATLPDARGGGKENDLFSRLGIPHVAVRDIFPDTVEAALRTIEESVRQLCGRGESPDSLEG